MFSFLLAPFLFFAITLWPFGTGGDKAEENAQLQKTAYDLPHSPLEFTQVRILAKEDVVNKMPLEDYLKGVLPGEMNPRWPEEALKAQAVASRTYALFKMIEHREDRYDVRSDVMSQVYKGKSAHHLASDRAILLTRGQILAHRGKVFSAYFHSTCGGHTAKAEAHWPVTGHPSLKGVACSFCRHSKHYRWQAVIPAAEIEARLRKAGYSFQGIKRIAQGERDASGRTENVIIEDSTRELKMRANDFRVLVGPEKIKSTLWDSMTQKEDQFYFKGRGWGHGAGLCQYGTKYLAELGYKYDQILNYYYPESEIKQYWS